MKLSPSSLKVGLLAVPLVFTVFAAAVTVAGPAIADIEKICKKHTHTGSGRSVSNKTARFAARVKWRYGVIKHDKNPLYAEWSRANNKTSKCKKKYYGWKCRYQAKPCRVSFKQHGHIGDLPTATTAARR